MLWCKVSPMTSQISLKLIVSESPSKVETSTLSNLRKEAVLLLKLLKVMRKLRRRGRLKRDSYNLMLEMMTKKRLRTPSHNLTKLKIKMKKSQRLMTKRKSLKKTNQTKRKERNQLNKDLSILVQRWMMESLQFFRPELLTQESLFLQTWTFFKCWN